MPFQTRIVIFNENLLELENVAIANALQLEAGRGCAVPLRFNFVAKISHSIAQHVIRVRGHKVKHSNRNNSAAVCSISLKFRSEFDRAKPPTTLSTHLQGQRLKVKVTGSEFKVTA